MLLAACAVVIHSPHGRSHSAAARGQCIHSIQVSPVPTFKARLAHLEKCCIAIERDLNIVQSMSYNLVGPIFQKLNLQESYSNLYI